MELLPPVKREPYRPPPRALEEGDLGPGTGEPDAATVGLEPNGSVPALEAAASPDAAPPEALPTFTEVAIVSAGVIVEAPPAEAIVEPPSVAAPPLPEAAPAMADEGQPPPDAAAEGFGAGIPDAPPSG